MLMSIAISANNNNCSDVQRAQYDKMPYLEILEQFSIGRIWFWLKGKTIGGYQFVYDNCGKVLIRHWGYSLLQAFLSKSSCSWK